MITRPFVQEIVITDVDDWRIQGVFDFYEDGIIYTRQLYNPSMSDGIRQIEEFTLPGVAVGDVISTLASVGILDGREELHIRVQTYSIE